MEKFTTYEKAMAYLDCANNYVDAIWNLDIDVNLKRASVWRHFEWVCKHILELKYNDITDDEFNQIADTYDKFKIHCDELCK